MASRTSRSTSGWSLAGKFTTITPIASRLVLADGYEERDGRGDYQVGVYSKGFKKPRQPSC